ncbi:response regulator transcription factor [Sporosarcina pasteurii]|uniref:Staphylococcal respiratory response protein A n=1 Tax=Sporosarcina pasteurii TaxID=1474 RepID=A0A380BL76_SPOPA|nr:response regulator transcription factor [Sporosarcina pasteurii]MDS9470891.1 response regulator transcription factor [Sporosarcina pasteurii]QBQ05449.1 response regulator transcription factor [Sporosarcina pasteurii]SUJ03167.1 Staphylococcal respiratory response protein A [Sporosarcina pasteurii]
MTKILLVDDEDMILEVLEAYFEKEGWEIFLASNGIEALKKIKENDPDIIILDLMLPDISGEEVCRLTRKDNDVPIIMLTAKSAEEDLINGIVIGADDYVTKPFSPREVVIRAKAILRRVNKTENEKLLSFNHGKLKIDLFKKKVELNHQIVSLTPIEYKLLVAMASYPGRVYSRAELLEKVQEDGAYYEGYERSIDTHVKNLRRKIEADSRQPIYIQTVFGMGYKFGGTSNALDTSF